MTNVFMAINGSYLTNVQITRYYKLFKDKSYFGFTKFVVIGIYLLK